MRSGRYAPRHRRRDNELVMLHRLRVFAACALLVALPALGQSTLRSPGWSQLSDEEQRILAPIQSEWDGLDTQRKLKWLGIAKRYPQMSAEAQERLQRQMRDWVELSTEQRRAVREKYRDIEKLDDAERKALAEKWEQYQREAAEKRAREAADEAEAASNEEGTKDAAPKGAPATSDSQAK